MLSIADHIASAEPVSEGSDVYKAVSSDGRVSAVQVFQFPVTPEQYQLFTQQVSTLGEAVRHNRASVPAILSWGFTQTGNDPFVEMEWIEGYDLTTLPNRDKEVTLEEFGSIAEQVSRVLTLCHGVGVVHGNISGKQIMWDVNRQQYTLTGFTFGLQASGIGLHNNTGLANEKRDMALMQKDIHDLGLVLLTLINAHLLPDNAPQLTNLKSSLTRTQLKDGTELPAWIGTCLYRALSSGEERFKTAHEMYSYVILHHKTRFETNRWFRSKPQQPLTLPARQVVEPPKHRRNKVQAEGKSARRTATPDMRFVFDRRIALGLVIAAVLVGVSIIAQNRRDANTPSTTTGATANTALQDTTNNTAEQARGQEGTGATVQKRKPAKTKQPNNKQVALQQTAATDVGTEQEAGDSDLGAYKVRSRAYFHNAPDEKTRRNAFIVHWNNAVLHPSREENDFVYVVYTNDEGQTTKGWLRKKDLVKQ
jgi:eukaryotic-like serine/threonine-protein kinase